MVNRRTALLAGFLLLLPILAHAEIQADLRIKLGGAAGIDKVDIEGTNQTVDPSSGGNFQLELALSPKSENPVTFVGTIGIFSREHDGNTSVLSLPTNITYDAGGLCGSLGVGFSTSDAFHFEVRYEIAAGTGTADLSTPGVVWNEIKDGDYTASTLLLGGYFTFGGKSGFQAGLEIGAQSFEGKGQIWNNAGYWSDFTLKGSGGIVNISLGYRF